MRREREPVAGPAEGANRPRLPARAFYGVILTGLLLGLGLAVFGGWRYLAAGDRKPTGRRTLDGAAEGMVIPISAMMGATFGGLAGFAAAAVWDRRRGGRPAGAAAKRG